MLKNVESMMNVTFSDGSPNTDTGFYKIQGWKSNEPQQCEMRHGDFIVHKECYYFISVQLYFQAQKEGPLSLSYPAQQVSGALVYRNSTNWGEKVIARSAHEPSSVQNESRFEVSPRLDAVVHMKEGDSVFVTVNHKDLLYSHDPETVHFMIVELEGPAADSGTSHINCHRGVFLLILCFLLY